MPQAALTPIPPPAPKPIPPVAAGGPPWPPRLAALLLALGLGFSTAAAPALALQASLETSASAGSLGTPGAAAAAAAPNAPTPEPGAPAPSPPSSPTLQAQAAAAVPPAFERQVLEVLRQHPEAVFEALQTQLKRIEQRKRQARQEALTQLERDPAALIGSSPTLGQGRTRLLVFSDFQCPYCAEAARNLSAFLAKNGGKLSLTYKFYPLVRIHPEALGAARAAWAAQQQGRFWPFHDALFAAQDRLGEPLYLDTARRLGLDLNRFNSDRQSPASLEAIERDRELGDRLGLEGTPFFAVNGEAFSAAVDEAFLQKLVQGR